MGSIGQFNKAIGIIKNNTKGQDLSVQQLQVYLDVAESHPEAQSYGQIGVRIGIHAATVSKYCKMLGDHFVKSRDGDVIHNKGFQLLKVDRNPLNTRQLLVSLSKQGERLMIELEKTLN